MLQTSVADFSRDMYITFNNSICFHFGDFLVCILRTFIKHKCKSSINILTTSVTAIQQIYLPLITFH